MAKQKEQDVLVVQPSELIKDVDVVAKVEFVNPFDVGISYKDFLEAVKVSKKTVKEYLKGELTDEQIEFIEKELKLITNTNK